MSAVAADPMFVVPDPSQQVYSDSPPPLPYDRRPHSDILDEAAARLRRNGVASGGYWRSPDGARLDCDDDVSEAPTCMLGAMIPLHPDGTPKISERRQMPRTTPPEVFAALRVAADGLLKERFPHAPSFADYRGKFMLSTANDWLADNGHADTVPDIVDRAHGYL